MLPVQEPGQYNYLDPDWHPYYRSTGLHTMQSVSKSVTATLFGVALLQGEIEDLGDPADEFFSAFSLRDERWTQSTLADLLTMRSGIEWVAGRGYGGQLLIVVPQQELIAVFTGWNVYDKPSLSWLFALERLLDATS